MNFRNIRIVYRSTPITISGSIDPDSLVKICSATVKGINIDKGEIDLIETNKDSINQIKYILGI